MKEAHICKTFLFAAIMLVVPVDAWCAEATPPEPISNPGEWISPNDYPITALRNGESGTTGFVLTISKVGRVTDCEIIRTSGSQSLDEATCERLQLHGLFTPAKSASGRPVIGVYRNRVRWMNPNSEANLVMAGALSTPSVLIIGYTVSPDGSVSDCHVERAEAVPGLSVEQTKLRPKACPQIQTPPPTDAGGQRVTRHMRMTLRLEMVDP